MSWDEITQGNMPTSKPQGPRVNVNTIALVSAIFALFYLGVSFLPLTSSYFVAILLAWPFYLLYFLLAGPHPYDPEGAALGAGILMEFIGPLFAFLCWFVVLYIVAKISIWVSPKFSAKIKLSHPGPYSKKILVACVIVTIIFTAITPTYYYIQSRKELAQYSAEKQQTINKYAGSYPGSSFSVPEIGIKFKLPSDLRDLTYTVIQNDSARIVIGFSSNSLAAFPGCFAKDMPLGVLVRYPKSGGQDMEKMTGFLLLDGPREYNLSCSNGCGYHPYSPYTLGSNYFFYDDPFEVTDNPTNPDYKYRTHPMGYLNYPGACSSNAVAVDLQMKQLGILRPAMSTVNLIQN